MLVSACLGACIVRHGSRRRKPGEPAAARPAEPRGTPPRSRPRARAEFVATEELYQKTFGEVQEVIAELTRIIAAGDYDQWLAYLTEDYVRIDAAARRSSPKPPRAAVLKKNGIVLQSLKDYFDNVVVRSRLQATLDDITVRRRDAREGHHAGPGHACHPLLPRAARMADGRSASWPAWAKLTREDGSRNMSTNSTRAARRARHSPRALAVGLPFLVGSGVSALPRSRRPPRPPSKEITIEELFLQSVEFQILREKAFSEDYDIKMSALDDLEKKVSDGSYKGERPAGGVRPGVPRPGRLGAHHARGRAPGEQLPRGAAQGRRTCWAASAPTQAKDALVRVLLIDEEPMVKAEAAYALGVIGKNQDNEVVQALAFAYNQEDPTKPDNNFGYALCLAIEKLAQKTPGASRIPPPTRCS